MEYQIKNINEIKGFELYIGYKVDTNGIIYTKKGKPFKPSKNHNGYLIVTLCQNGIPHSFSVHNIVAKAFIPNPENKPTVNHINGKKDKNNVENLEWATNKEQTYHSINVLGFDNSSINNYHAKRTIGRDKSTGEIIYDFPTLHEAGKFFNPEHPHYSHINIVRVVKDSRKSYKGCVWELIPYNN